MSTPLCTKSWRPTKRASSAAVKRVIILIPHWPSSQGYHLQTYQRKLDELLWIRLIAFPCNSFALSARVRCCLPIVYLVRWICIISGPFWSKFREIYDFWLLEGGSPPFHEKMCIWENRKCSISVPGPSHLNLYIGPIRFGELQGAAPHCCLTQIVYQFFWWTKFA